MFKPVEHHRMLNLYLLLEMSHFFLFSQTLLTMGRTIQDSVDEMGTRIYTALKKVISSFIWENHG